MKHNLIIVDAYSSGNLLAPAFQARGTTVHHVQSTKEIWPTMVPSFRPDDFESYFAFDENFKELVAWAKKLNPVAVIAGTETGVELADRLSEAIGMSTSNGTKMSEARRNKFLMIEACRRAGLRVAQQIESRNWEETKNWLSSQNIKKFVLKPVKSAWTDQVVICEDLQTGYEAFFAIIGTTNKLGLFNDSVLVQEFLEGTEYYVNSVSLHSQHYFTDIWRYEKRSLHGYDRIYDTDILCPSDGVIEKAMTTYVGQVLDTLEIKFGPAHAEIMVGPHGPILVEIGARLDGITLPDFNRQSVGLSGLDLTCDVYLEPKKFIETTKTPYLIRKKAMTVYLTSFVHGIIKSIPGEMAIRKLPSFFAMRFRVKTGDAVAPTTSFFTCPGFINLLHEDAEVLNADRAFIRDWEKTQLFELEKS